MTILATRPGSLLGALVLSLSLLQGACGPSAAARRAQALYDRGDYAGAAAAADSSLRSDQGDDDLWRVRVRAALAQADAAGIAAQYDAYRAARGGADDAALLTDMAMATLKQGLGSPSRDAKVAAVMAVEDLMLMPLADQVAELMNDADPRVMAAASIAVLRGYPGAAYAATDALASDDPVARAIAVAGIGQKVGAIAGDDLRKMAADPVASVRAAAIAAVAPLTDDASRAVVDAALDDRDPVVRAAAADALARRKGGVTAAQVAAALGDAERSVRIAGVAMAKAHDAARVAPLLADADLHVALAAGRALGSAGGAAVSALFERAIASDDHAVRAAAINGWGGVFGKAAAATRARALLMDPSHAVRRAAARALAYGDPAAAGEAGLVLRQIAEDPKAGAVATTAAAELAALGDRAGETLLGAQLLTAASAEARQRIVLAHRNVAQRVTPALVAALADVDGEVRVMAAAALVALARAD
jgi:HEAT repeat protein